MTPTTTPVDFVGQQRALQAEEEQLLAHAGTLTDTVAEMTRRLRLEKIEQELREVQPHVRAQRASQAHAAARLSVEDGEAVVAGLVAPGGPVSRLDALVEDMATTVKEVEAALASLQIVDAVSGSSPRASSWPCSAKGRRTTWATGSSTAYGTVGRCTTNRCR
jgi:hypothetical protein